MATNRRQFLAKLGIGTLAGAAVLGVKTPALAACQRTNGAGAYQVGPFPAVKHGDEPVFLTADLGFDETMIFCKITTNFLPFIFQTARMGPITFNAHEFYMDMRSVSVASMSITTDTAGPHAHFTGLMRSETRVFSGDKQKIFIEDNITFSCDSTAMSSGTNVDVSKTNFSMTVQFDPTKEHAAIFGNTATFAGRVMQGNIIIVA